MKRIYMTGNTHFDPVWLWTWDEGLASIRSTFRAALDRMDEDDEFIYSFACPPVFEQIAEVDPELMERIRARVKEGRWSLDEGMWVQPDCFSAGLESYVRQCLHGQRYLMETFGRYSDTVFNIDSFGHPAMLPQVYRQARLKYSVISRPDEADMRTGDPLFRWTAPDGSGMLTCRVNMLGGIYPTDTEKVIREALPMLDRFDHDLMMVYGVTNHGGAPTKKSLAAIRRMREESGGRVTFGSTTDFFSRQEGADVPEWRGEIPIRHFGVFINRPDVKQLNRKAEYALTNAERAAFLAGTDRTKELAAHWRTLMYNQFHDILGGASLSDACVDALRQMGGAAAGAEQVMHIALQRMTREIDLSNSDAKDAAWNLVIWNLNPADYSGWLEAEVQWAWEFDWYRGGITLTDENGNDIPCQKVLPRSVIPGFRTRFVFRADVPAMGWRTLRVRQREALPDMGGMQADERTLSDGKIRVTLDDSGGISEIYDLQTGRVLMDECARPVAVEDMSDVWAFNFTGYGGEQSFRLESARIIESGPLRVGVKVRSRLEDLVVEQTIRLYRETGMVDGQIRVQWNGKHKALKLGFRGGDRLQSASPGYGEAREFDGRELPCGGWIDLRDEDGSGALVLTDCFFGFDTTRFGRVRGTVLRSPIVGDLRIEELPEDDYEYMSQGDFTGRWRVIPHGPKDAGHAWREMDAFLNRPVVLDEANHPGVRPMTGSLMRMTGNDAVRAAAVKFAEDGSGDAIVRLQNMGSESANVEVELNGRGRLTAEMRPYEIRTMRQGENGWTQTDLLEEI